MRVLSCDSSYGQGGVGQHFAQLVEGSRQEGILECYYSPGVKPNDTKGRKVTVRTYGLLKYTPLRFSPSWKSHLLNELLDYKVAKAIDEPAERFMGFVGKSLRTFRRTTRLGFKQLELVAVNSHVHNLKRLHEKAHRQLGIRDSWLNSIQVRKTLREYDRADIIYVHSAYTRQSFVDAGFAPEKLRRTYLKIDPYFQPPTQRPSDGVFRVAYVGRVEATKGIPLLLEAFAQLSAKPAELTLVGGWSTGAMRKHVEGWIDRGLNIEVAPGDPLPALQEANVFVHPTYEDGFGYAPMEALACGVPVIVTEDTGMKEYVREGENGYIVPTGSSDAILNRMEKIADGRGPQSQTESFLAEEQINAYSLR